MSEPITWPALREAIASIHGDITGARDSARDAILNPDDSIPAGTEYRLAFADLFARVDFLQAGIERVLEIVAEAQPPARPLEAVLADIEAEGHEYTIDSNYGGGGKVRFTSKLREPRWDNAGDWDKEKWARHRAWEQEVEAGDTWLAGSLVEVAEARLAQIRALHEQQCGGAVALAAAIAGVGACVQLAGEYGLSPSDFMTAEEMEAEQIFPTPRSDASEEGSA